MIPHTVKSSSDGIRVVKCASCGHTSYHTYPLSESSVKSTVYLPCTCDRIRDAWPTLVGIMTPLSEDTLVALGDLLKQTGISLVVGRSSVRWNTQDKTFECTEDRITYTHHGDIKSAIGGERGVLYG